MENILLFTLKRKIIYLHTHLKLDFYPVFRTSNIKKEKK
jgi:hypothetical protein